MHQVNFFENFIRRGEIYDPQAMVWKGPATVVVWYRTSYRTIPVVVPISCKIMFCYVPLVEIMRAEVRHKRDTDDQHDNKNQTAPVHANTLKSNT